MKRFFVAAFIAFSAISFAGNVPVDAASPLRIEVLERSDCAHCQAEHAFLDELKNRRDDIEIRFYDTDDKGRGAELFQEVTSREKLSKSTPVTLIGGVVIQGFATPETTGKRFEELLDRPKGDPRMTFDQYLRAGPVNGTEVIEGASCEGETCRNPDADSFLVPVPFVGAVDAARYSLPTLSVVLGFVDGFNPCAMWVLVTFLIMLMQTGSRKKMLQVAGLFVIAEAVMYYLILNVWFTAWDFIGLDRVVTPIVGIVAVFGGAFFLYEWYKSLGTDLACQIVDAENRSKIIGRIKAFVTGEFTWLAAIGVIGLAFSVNVIEFACSIGIPQAFTKIVELNHLGFWSTQGLMAIYIFFYMVDDLLVFGLALWGADKLHLTKRYSQISSLIGGVLMLILGYLLMFHPAVIRNFG